MEDCRFKKALIFDFDGSVTFKDAVDRKDFRSMEERFRYCASFKDIGAFAPIVRDALKSHRVFFLGNGDFHHMSYPIIKALPEALGLKTVQVLVFDNHPDNMFFPRGIHCGSWVYHAARLANVSSVTVVGITSRDLSGVDLFQNRFSVVRSGKVGYYCLMSVSGLARRFGGNNIFDIRDERASLASIVGKRVSADGSPVYLSIDKDVLSPEALKTTWDQGSLKENELLSGVKAIASRVVVADVCGDISTCRFKGPLKRFARWLDGAEPLPPDMEKERQRHEQMNIKILSTLKDITGR